MTADDFLAATTTRLPTPDELVGLVRALGGRVVAGGGSPRVRGPVESHPLFQLLVRLLKREPWRSAAVLLAEPDAPDPPAEPVPTPPPGDAAVGELEPPPTRATVLAGVFERGRVVNRRVWLIDDRGRATDPPAAALACVEGDTWWTRLPTG
ncbi:hypothetical protein [Fimbriiglobus ruber]|uniref:Uncharacterized protein n=1 Tax=Fimbriiglobus ruber TaxID=1908690 RepID=A0A225E8M4_9BACT|nr:hypothetical protein [Fimbriiglobus ruber]OWK45829.1 hypothetical protein FRUB_02160 [Fimbriiglobus ruber]